MGEIVSSVQRVSTTIGEITPSTAEQSEGLDRINAAISVLDGVTQHNSALVERSRRFLRAGIEAPVKITSATPTRQPGNSIAVDC